MSLKKISSPSSCRPRVKETPKVVKRIIKDPPIILSAIDVENWDTSKRTVQMLRKVKKRKEEKFLRKKGLY